MSGRDRTVAELLDGLVPQPAGVEDWNAVLRDAAIRRRGRVAAVLAPAAAAVAVAAGVLLWPFGDERQGGVLDRALAAVGTGASVHVVFEDDWGGTVVDLRTGSRRRLHGEREIWYEPSRGLRQVSRFGGVVQQDVTWSASDVPRQLARTYGVFAGGYANALRTGRARVVGESVVRGESVYWLRVYGESLPDAADGRLHEWAQEVAISKETYRPVAMRETRDGAPGPDTGARVIAYETVGSAPLGEPDGRETIAGRESAHAPVTPAEAARLLGRSALWAGREVQGLAVSNISASRVQTGRVRLVQSEVRPSPCDRPPCPDRVFRADGPVDWDAPLDVVEVAYGVVTPGRSEPSGAFVVINQTDRAARHFGRGALGYFPPEGMVVVFGGKIAKLRHSGLYLAIEASSEDVMLAAARALEPMPN